MRLSRTKSGVKRKNHYKSIFDLPLYNWIELRRSENLSFLLKDPKKHGKELQEFDKNTLYSIYLDMMTEFYKEFGQSKNFLDELKLKQKIIALNIKFSKTGDRNLLNGINVLNTELIVLQNNNIDRSLGVDINEEMNKQIAFVSSSIRSLVDTKEIKVVQFYRQLTISKVSLN